MRTAHVVILGLAVVLAAAIVSNSGGQQTQTVATPQGRYQLYLTGEGNGEAYLVDTHLGHVWMGSETSQNNRSKWYLGEVQGLHGGNP